MATVTITEIIDDLRAADEITRHFERRYWLSSDVFYELYSQGLLDNGENLEDFAEWAGFYKIKRHREKLLREFSEQRVGELRETSQDDFVSLIPEEPLIEVA